jgi:hypothetical protein
MRATVYDPRSVNEQVSLVAVSGLTRAMQRSTPFVSEGEAHAALASRQELLVVLETPAAAPAIAATWAPRGETSR